jgi:[protein-PII] uridylyltransferase
VTPFIESVTEYMLLMLWDLGLRVGHASRNTEECLKLAREDHTIQTALLEGRYIAGDQSLALDLDRRFRKEVVQRNHAGFIAAKLKERDERHARVGASRYMVEPNIKEGKGGLRDLHTLFWLARHRYGFSRLKEYVAAGVLTEEERFAFRRALRFLWTVRCHLHFITGRAEERLTFDLQPELASRLGYSARSDHSEVERFMKRYFLVAKEVGVLTRVLCAKLEADNAKKAPGGLQRLFESARRKTAPETPGFFIDGGRLSIDSPNVLQKPANVIKLFEIAERLEICRLDREHVKGCAVLRGVHTRSDDVRARRGNRRRKAREQARPVTGIHKHFRDALNFANPRRHVRDCPAHARRDHLARVPFERFGVVIEPVAVFERGKPSVQHAVFVAHSLQQALLCLRGDLGEMLAHALFVRAAAMQRRFGEAIEIAQ